MDGLFYLSFADKRLPQGQRFVGATIVHGADERGAFERAQALGLVPPDTEVALVELWTQDPLPQVRITRLTQLPLSARQLLNTLVGPEQVKRYGAHKMPDEIVTGFVCDSHTRE